MVLEREGLLPLEREDVTLLQLLLGLLLLFFGLLLLLLGLLLLLLGLLLLLLLLLLPLQCVLRVQRVLPHRPGLMLVMVLLQCF